MIDDQTTCADTAGVPPQDDNTLAPALQTSLPHWPANTEHRWWQSGLTSLAPLLIHRHQQSRLQNQQIHVQVVGADPVSCRDCRNGASSVTEDFLKFIWCFQMVFNHPAQGHSCGDWLLLHRIFHHLLDTGGGNRVECGCTTGTLPGWPWPIAADGAGLVQCESGCQWSYLPGPELGPAPVG